MPHVSPKQVNKKVSQQIYDILFASITSKNVTQKQQRLAFGELLTSTEKIMLGKRLAAIYMLSRGVSAYRASKVLQLSPTTTAKLQIRLEKKRVNNLAALCRIVQKGPLQYYIENLFKPLPRYSTSPASLFKDK